MEKDKAMKATRSLLLAFVLLTIGFVMGKEFTRHSLQAESVYGDQGTQDRVAVYYTHASVSCVTCTTMERLIKETLDEQFAGAMTGQSLSFQKVDFQRDKAFAQRYQIVANAVVVTLIRQGKEQDFQRLDDIWTLYEDPAAFKQYVGDAIQSYVQELEGPTS
jgi:hypothetical protein